MAADHTAHFALSLAKQLIRALRPLAQQLVRALGRLNLEVVHDVLQLLHTDHDKPPLATQVTPVQGRCHRSLSARPAVERARPR